MSILYVAIQYSNQISDMERGQERERGRGEPAASSSQAIPSNRACRQEGFVTGWTSLQGRQVGNTDGTPPLTAPGSMLTTGHCNTHTHVTPQTPWYPPRSVYSSKRMMYTAVINEPSNGRNRCIRVLVSYSSQVNSTQSLHRESNSAHTAPPAARRCRSRWRLRTATAVLGVRRRGVLGRPPTPAPAPPCKP